jgi:hypothetical protein
VLISYRDRSQVDTDTVVHPGQGRNMDLDAHPRPIRTAPGDPRSPGAPSCPPAARTGLSSPPAHRRRS